MINTKHLMIGNFVNRSYHDPDTGTALEECEVMWIRPTRVGVKTKYGVMNLTPEEIEPIECTNEWAKKLTSKSFKIIGMKVHELQNLLTLEKAMDKFDQ